MYWALDDWEIDTAAGVKDAEEGSEKYTKALTSLEAQGWTLVCVTQGPNGHRMFFLHRDGPAPG